MHDLAELYIDGTHPDGKNIREAGKLLKMAAELGNICSINKLVELYINLSYSEVDNEKDSNKAPLLPLEIEKDKIKDKLSPFLID